MQQSSLLRNKFGCSDYKVTAKHNYDNVTDKHLLWRRSFVTDIDQDPHQEQHSSNLCDECGFEPCACRYVVETCVRLDYWIVNHQGEV
jgi:hypothetical protein